MRKLLLLPLVLSILILTACPTIQENARDTSAALGGAITAAQTQHQTACVAKPTDATCVLINKAIAAQNTLITGTEAYCGWTAGVSPTDPNAVCIPVASAKAALQTAINNANTFIVQLKGVIQ
jgi:hypothetical protein